MIHIASILLSRKPLDLLCVQSNKRGNFPQANVDTEGVEFTAVKNDPYELTPERVLVKRAILSFR